MSSAKFWVACNQTMQKYVEAAAQGMERISAAGKSNADVAAANRQVVEEFDQKLQEFAQYQKLSCKTMEQVRRLLTDISAAGSSDRVQLTAGRNLPRKNHLRSFRKPCRHRARCSRNFWKKSPKTSENFPKEFRKDKLRFV